MDPECLLGPDASLEIGRLAFGHLGLSDEISYAPTIHRAKESIARARIAVEAPPDEPLLVLYDGTFLGTSTRGFAVTERRFCFRSPLGAPRSILWEALRATAITVGTGLGIGRDTVGVRGALRADTAHFLEEIGRRLAPEESSPYRRQGTRDRPEDADGSADSVALLAWHHLGALAGVRYHPFISGPRLARARRALGAHLPADETEAVVYEDTLRLAPQGFVITSERLAWYAGDTYDGPGGRGSFLWSTLDRSEIRAVGSAVHVRGIALPWLKRMGAPDDSTRAMVVLFRALAADAEALRGVRVG